MATPRAHAKLSDQLMTPVVDDALKALTLAPEDAAAARLARRYAQVIDSDDDPGMALATFGPKLLAALTALGATPSGRKAGSGGVTLVGTRLATLRASRQH